MWFWYHNPDKPETNYVIVHRRDAEDAKAKNIFLSADLLKSATDMKGRKKKLSFKASIKNNPPGVDLFAFRLLNGK